MFFVPRAKPEVRNTSRFRVVYKANPLTGGYGIIGPGSSMNAAE